MTNHPAAEAIARAAAQLVPALTERLQRHGLGEIEVSQGDLRVRVTAGDRPTRQPGVDVTVVRPAAGSPPPSGAVGAGSSGGPGLASVTSPAVGHFVYAEGLGPGLAVTAGSDLGFVEMLGIRHEVRAPSDGVVRHLVTESGEPVEYGQTLVEVEVEVEPAGGASAGS